MAFRNQINYEIEDLFAKTRQKIENENNRREVFVTIPVNRQPRNNFSNNSNNNYIPKRKIIRDSVSNDLRISRKYSGKIGKSKTSRINCKPFPQMYTDLHRHNTQLWRMYNVLKKKREDESEECQKKHVSKLYHDLKMTLAEQKIENLGDKICELEDTICELKDDFGKCKKYNYNLAGTVKKLREYNQQNNERIYNLERNNDKLKLSNSNLRNDNYQLRKDIENLKIKNRELEKTREIGEFSSSFLF